MAVGLIGLYLFAAGLIIFTCAIDPLWRGEGSSMGQHPRDCYGVSEKQPDGIVVEVRFTEPVSHWNALAELHKEKVRLGYTTSSNRHDHG
jgi:hypothetical protein